MEQYEVNTIVREIVEHELLMNGLMEYDIRIFQSLDGSRTSNCVIVDLLKNELLYYEWEFNITTPPLIEYITDGALTCATELIKMIKDSD